MSSPDCTTHQARWRADLRQLTAVGVRARYPWALFLGGDVTLLRHGEDFLGAPARMQSAITNAAWRRGVRVRTSVTPDGDVAICVLGRAEEAQREGAA